MKWFPLLGVVGAAISFSTSASAQDYSVLRINEVIADNGTQEPADVGGGHVDMVEIYNSGTEALVLGASNVSQSLAFTDTPTLPLDPAPWTFPSGTTIQPGKFILVFCDGDAAAQGTCELHTLFSIASDGTEPLTLWGPVTGTVDGKPVRPIIDQVWLPPLSSDVSFGRFPDGAGPAPVPLAEVLDTFHFYPRGTSTFGNCSQLPTPCAGNTAKKQFCPGASNASVGGNLPPHVNLVTHSTNHPAAGEAVRLRVKVDDEKGPLAPNISLVEILYRVNGGAEQHVQMTYDAAAGVAQGTYDCNGSEPGTELCPNPFDLWTYWDGQIPGQNADAVVEFSLNVVDAQGASDTSPDVFCPEGLGPCDRDFGGPGCPFDAESQSCTDPVRTGLKYLECRKPFRYKVAYTPGPAIASLVINEVVAHQDGILKDTTERACDATEDMCPVGKPECCKFREDFIELFNSSPSQTIDLAGLGLSDGPFNPFVWRFPAGSKILPLEHLIVWLDKDGGKCPNNSEPNKPCFWECPDPTDPATQEYHTSFALDASSDEIYLFDTESNGFGVVDGLEFKGFTLNHALARVPDGSRSGCWIDVVTPTPRDPNQGACPGVSFLRGDANANCGVDLSDAIYTLGYLFTGGGSPLCPDAADSDDSGKVDISDAIFTLGYLFLGSRSPPLPGADTAGIDPTTDDLAECNAPSC